jgi:signal peptidase II
MPRRTPQLLLLVLCLSTIGCDQVSKNTATALLSTRAAVPIVEGVFELRYTENRGIAFGLLHDFEHTALPWVLGFGALAATAAILVHWWRRRSASLLEQASYAAIIGGSVGNGLDRLNDGTVVDFLHVSGWPVFNVADVAIAAGAVLLILAKRAGPAVTVSDPPAGVQ